MIGARACAGAATYFPCNAVCCSQFGACALDAATATTFQCCASGVVCGGQNTCACGQSPRPLCKDDRGMGTWRGI